MVMEQLTSEGHVIAAHRLHEELERSGAVTPSAITTNGGDEEDAGQQLRCRVREAVLTRHVDTALDLLQHHCPLLLRDDPVLLARLYQQQIIDHLSCDDGRSIAAAVHVATAQLVPLAASLTTGAAESGTTAVRTQKTSGDSTAADRAALQDIIEETAMLVSFPSPAAPLTGTPVASDGRTVNKSHHPPDDGSGPSRGVQVSVMVEHLGLAHLFSAEARDACSSLLNRKLLAYQGVTAIPRIHLLLQWLRYLESQLATDLGLTPPSSSMLSKLSSALFSSDTLVFGDLAPPSV